jgi:uncharacterized membrane protein YbhN (UPF0104 family)
MDKLQHAPATTDGDATFHELRRSLADGAFEPVARRPGVGRAILLVVAGLALTGLLIRNAGEAGSFGEVLADRRGALWGFFLCTNVYVLFKGLALRTAARCCGVRASMWRSLRVFCESSLVGFVVAKIAADVYKYARVGDGSRGDRVRAILVYRISAICGVLLLAAVVSYFWAEQVTLGWFVWLVPAGVIAGILAFYRSRATNWVRDHGAYLLRVLPYSLGALVAKIAGLSILLGVALEGGVVEAAAAFLVVGSLASMTQVPAGLGTLDAGYAVFFTKVLGASGGETAAFLVALRLLGPVYVGLLGGLSMAWSSVVRLRAPQPVVTSNPDLA